MTDVGGEMHGLCRRLFPICRSITGHGVRESLAVLREFLPGLRVVEVPTGTRCFDWTVPREWNIRDAYFIDPRGRKWCDFRACNLHVVGYSTPVDAVVSLGELQEHLYSLPEQPDAVPYVTSYYQERWGFCIAERARRALPPGDYRVRIDSDLTDGSLTYGELVIPGRTPREVLLSTYLCHPSLANNELSGPAVATFLARRLSAGRNNLTYRVIFVPETIGSIAYLSTHLDALRRAVVAGFVVTCVGDDRAYSYLPSRRGDTLADRAALHALKHTHPDFVRYSFLDRGSDERQYCSPGVDLPVCSLMRSKYGCYPEYHTSLDDLSLVTPGGLQGGYEVLGRALEVLEGNETLAATVPCEPQLGRRGLYPTLSARGSARHVADMMNVLAYCDGGRDLLGVAEVIGRPLWEIRGVVDRLKEEGLLRNVEAP